MADCGLLRFGDDPRRAADNPTVIIACQDSRRMSESADTIRDKRVRAKSIAPSALLTTFRGTLALSVGEWIVTTQACRDPSLEVGQFAQIVGIARSKSAIEIAHNDEIKQIDLDKFAAIRSATTVTIREARGLPANTRLVVELAEHRHIWAALLLVARRHADSQLYVDAALARSVEELTEIAGRSLPAALPHQRKIKPDLNAEIGKILLSTNAAGSVELELFPQPSATTPTPPRPIHAQVSVCSMIASSVHTIEGYRLLYDHVGPHNPDRDANTERVLGLCNSELTATLIRFLADLEVGQARDEFHDFDLPPELPELDPSRWTIEDIERAKNDLRSVAIPGSNWNLRPRLPPAPAITLDV